MINSDLRSKLISLPKFDPHVHLEGTISFKTLEYLSNKNLVPLDSPTKFNSLSVAAPSPENLLAYSSLGFIGSFYEFISLYLKISNCIKGAEDIVFVAESYAREARAEGVLGAEIYVTPSTLLSLGMSQQELTKGLLESQALLASKVS